MLEYKLYYRLSENICLDKDSSMVCLLKRDSRVVGDYYKELCENHLGA